MAGDWFQADDNAPEKPEVQQVMSLTGCDVDQVLGRLWLLWRWVDQHADADDQVPGGGILRWMGVAELSRECRGDEHFWQAVASVGWLEFSERGVLIPGFEDRFPESAKKRALEARRKRIDRMQKQLDAEPEPRPRTPRRRGTSESGKRTETVRMEAGARKLRESVFARLTLDMLSNTTALLEWWTWACSQPNPVGVDDEWHQEHLLAAAERARKYSSGAAKSPIKNPVGFVASVMGAKQFVKLEPEDLQQGRARLASVRQLREQRAVDLRNCLQSPPTDEKPRTRTELKVAAIKFEEARKRKA